MARRSAASRPSLPFGELLQGLLAASPDAVVSFDSAGRIFGWNRAAEALLGWPRSEALGKNLQHLVAPESSDAPSIDTGHLDSGDQSVGQIYFHRRNGTRFLVDITASRMSLESAAPGYVAILRDATRPELLRDARAALTSHTETAQAVLAMSEAIKREVAFVHILVCAVDGDVPRPLFLVGSHGDLFLDLVNSTFEESPLGIAVRTGKRVVVQDTATPRFVIDQTLRENGVHSYVVVPLKEREEVFASLNVGFAEPNGPKKHILDILDAVADAVGHELWSIFTLEQQRNIVRDLSGLNQLKDDFLAMISHDIRTPLSVIAGFADTLANRWDEMDDDQKLHGVDAILRNGRNLTRLVEEGLQVALMESGTFKYRATPFDIGQLVKRTVADFSLADEGNRFSVEIDPETPFVIADEERCWQVLTNLISNAIKFSEPDTPIAVSIATENDHVSVHIRDRGHGIPAEEQGGVFEKFSRAHQAKSRKIRGSGLGLWISKSMIEAQGGIISVISQSGEGSEFSFTLPTKQTFH